MERAIVTAPRFVVSINGQQRCVAGFNGYAVLTASISFVRKDVQDRNPLFDGTASLYVGGMQRSEHVDWLNVDVFVGDEVNIRILDGGPFVSPSKRTSRGAHLYADMGRQLEARQDRLAKIGNVIPHRFEVLGNGKRLCMAGLEFGVLSMHLGWVRRDPASQPPHLSESQEDFEGGDVELHVGGLHNDLDLNWCNVYVDVGDEITVRILGPGPSDPSQSKLGG
jgi:hypothetical protein